MALTVIRTAFLELDEVNLGCLVPSAEEPGSEFWPLKPPAFDEDQISKRTIYNIRETLNKEKYTSFRARLTSYFTSKFTKQAASLVELIAPTSSLYYIKHPKKHFEELCKDDETKLWIEDTLKHFPIFLIVGFLTVTHVEVERGQQKKTEFEAAAEVSAADIVAPGAGAFTDTLNAGVNITAGHRTQTSTTFFAPGERIVGVQYRKVHFKLFSSDPLENAKLESNRWVMFMGDTTRGSEGRTSDSVIEASLEDSIGADDLEIDGKVHSEMIDDEELVFLDDE
jgi:hypothetical protein